MQRLTIAIVGGGLCGLLLAIALEKHASDVEYDIYEAAAELTPTGAGVTLQPRTLFVLRELGLERALLKIAGNGAKDGITVLHRKSDQREGFTFNETTPEVQWTIHRGELQKLLLDHISRSERIHLTKRLISYTQSLDTGNQIELRFQDGSTTMCDALFGADGLKSQVRAAMYTQLAHAAKKAGHEEEAASLRSCIPAVFSGNSVYRGLLKRDAVADGEAQPLNRSALTIYCGKNKNIVAYPISQGRVLNVAATFNNPELEGSVYEGPWTEDVSQEDVRKEYVGWEPEVEEIVQSVGSWSKWAINVVKDLPTFADGRVALLGDAAHAMTPYQGAGAGQGFEDVLMLGLLLGQSIVDKANIPATLKIYDQFRRPVAQAVAALSRQSGQMQALIYPELDAAISAGDASATEPEYLARIADNIERLKDWRRGTDVMKDCQSALRLLQERMP